MLKCAVFVSKETLFVNTEVFEYVCAYVSELQYYKFFLEDCREKSTFFFFLCMSFVLFGVPVMLTLGLSWEPGEFK